MIPPAAPTVWNCRRAVSEHPASLWPKAIDDAWRPLRQSWLGPGREDGINPGWTRATWAPDALCFDAVLTGRGARNRATRLNDRTWELGDIFEVFLFPENPGWYLEIHVTPENRRLQLRWPYDGLQRFRAHTATLEQFTVDDPGWVESETQVSAEAWATRLQIPAGVLGLTQFVKGHSLRAAVCRYDCTIGPEPRLSSTAPLTAPSFHQLAEWELLKLE